jgi:glutathione S-transferase
VLCKQHQALLKALYSRYRLKPSGGGLRPKVLKLDGWLALMAVSGRGAMQGTRQQGKRGLCGSAWWTACTAVADALSTHCCCLLRDQDACLVDSQFTLADANLAFLWSRMFVVDEVKDYVRCGLRTHVCLAHVTHAMRTLASE